MLFWLLVLPGLRLGDRSGWAAGSAGPLVQLFAFTPYVAAWSWLPAVLALATRRWPAGAVALVAAVALAAGRAAPGRAGRTAARRPGSTLRVMTSNMLFGGADAATIVALVREHRGRRAGRAGVHRRRPGRARAGRARRAAAAQRARRRGGRLRLRRSTRGSRSPARATTATTAASGRRTGRSSRPAPAPVLVESAHPLAPWAVRVNPDWRADLANEPRADPDGTPRILLGDFNSTLDHGPLRDLIASGYRDAAAAAGKGLIGTWPYDGSNRSRRSRSTTCWWTSGSAYAR